MSWLDELKAGDKVIVVHHGLYSGRHVATVSKVTATQIVVGDRCFRRKTGRECGGGAWLGSYLEQATPAAIAEIRKASRRNKAILAILDAVETDAARERLKAIPISSLEAAAKLLTEESAK